MRHFFIYMPFKFSPTSNIAKLIIVVELILVIYLLNTLTVSVYRGYQIDKVINEFETENRRIEDDNRQKSEDYEYFTSPNYIEKIAKQNLGLVNPGEEVIILSDQPAVSDENAPEDSSVTPYSDLNNAEKWWIFFFDRKTTLQ
jgi:cell division protein FtsB